MRGRRVLFSTATATVILLLATAPGFGAAKTSGSWCGRRGTADLICAQAGRSSLTLPGASVPVVLARRAPRRLDPETAVRVEAGATARATFGRQALCQLGDATSPTQIVTRWRGADRLYRQDDGVSYCSFARRATSYLPFFCDEFHERCPVLVKTNGSEVVVHTSNPVVLTICAGRVVVRVNDAAGFVEATHESSRSGRVRITLTQTDELVDLDVAMVHGACRRPVFAEQQAALRQAG